MVRKRLTRLRVHPRPGRPQKGVLVAGSLRLPCALGRTGVTHMKREGDGATPKGRHRLERAILRPDRRFKRAGLLPASPTRRDAAWCDEPRDGRYNRVIRLPKGASEERLWREDGLYDAVIVVGWNTCPRVRGRGSAIFMHMARDGYAPTAGCVALSRRDMGLLLERLGRNVVIEI